MTTITDKLAAALSDLMDVTDQYPANYSHVGVFDNARRSLAEYDASKAAPSLPTEFRVSWEIDAFNATTPREAAEEAREAMRRAHTTATVFTVQAADGTVTAVDLSGED